MKHSFYILLLFFSCFICNGQNTIDFLGIPVDGRKSDVVASLKNKGFRYDSTHDCLDGIFNGREVSIMVHENNGVVDRVMVWYPVPTALAKDAFNNLLSQFLSSDKYVSENNSYIPEDENISFELKHGKKYGAAFYPDPFVEGGDKQFQDLIAQTTAKHVLDIIESGELENPTEERIDALSNIISTRLIINTATGVVWFSLVDSPSEADCIMYIYYDNMKNQ